jgi:hypothetical protein
MDFSKKLKNELEGQFVGKNKNEISDIIQKKFDEERKILEKFKYFKNNARRRMWN